MRSMTSLKRVLTGFAADRLRETRRSNELLRQQNKLLEKQTTELTKVLVSLEKEAKRTREAADNIRAISMAPIRRELFEVIQSKQLGFMESVYALRNDRRSLARFGDGEFRLMYRREHALKFQRNSPELMTALCKVLTDPSGNTIIGMPQIFMGLHWSNVFAETWHFISPLAATQDQFINSHITRPIFFEQYGQDAVDAWRSVWEGRDAAVVTGKGSRFDLVPALFDNLSSVQEIFSTPTNAFSDLDRLVQEIEESGKDLVLLSLGPAATVAADMLAAKGIQALDIGHLSSSYEYVLTGAALPEHVPPIRG